MFIKILLSYILGYVEIKVEGYYIERFINICNNKNILLWNVKSNRDTIMYARIRISEFKKLKKISKTTKCKIEINRKRGLPFILNKYRKRKIFAIALITIVLLIMISSNYIWNIEIIADESINREEIIAMLEQEGLKLGTPKKNVDTKRVVNNIRLNRNDIAWIGIKLDGTNAIVEIIKGEERPQIVAEDEYCNIVSDKAGIITKISAQNGTIAVKVGDIVKPRKHFG